MGSERIQPERSQTARAAGGAGQPQGTEQTEREPWMDLALHLDAMVDEPSWHAVTLAERAGQPSADLDSVVRQLIRVRRALMAETGLVGLAQRETVRHQPQRLGKYLITRILGAGGQGTTYLAHDPILGRDVVVKVCAAPSADEQWASIVKEGKAMSQVSSPYVARCHEVHRAAGVAFLVREYIPGEPLSVVARKRPFSPREAIALVEKLAQGLCDVHAKDLLHRDLKPSNVIVRDDGTPCLIDFGLAGQRCGAEGPVSGGTPGFMSPEQARRELARIDKRTDIFGLGAILYFLLTRRPPFCGDDLDQTLSRNCAGTVVPVRRLAPGVPAWIERICMRCLAACPEHRYASAAELLAAIRAGRARDKALRYTGWAVLTAMFVVVTIAGYMLLPPHRSSPTPPSAAPAQGSESATSRPPEPADIIKHALLVAMGKHKLRNDFGIRLEILGALQSDTGPVRLEAGQTLKLQLELDRDAFVLVLSLEADGTVTQLFPNEYEQDNWLIAHRPQLIPGNSRYALQAVESRGRDLLYVLASTRPIHHDVPARRLGPYIVYDDEHAVRRLGTQLRGIVIAPQEAQEAVAECIVPYQVVAPARGGAVEVGGAP